MQYSKIGYKDGNKKVVLTGMQSSGRLHIGNYFGALKPFLDLKSNHDISLSYFMIADAHSLNSIPNPVDLQNNIIELSSSLLGCGISDEILFCQSHILHHYELFTYLGSISSIGRLERMTQFKDKHKKGSIRENESLGLLSYPVLQAADILLYKTDIVPVGIDQMQHLELVRHLAQKFNTLYKKDIFKIPKTFCNPSAEKIMSLSDGTKKMSKSDLSLGSYSCIGLTDSDDLISLKIKKAKTDSIKGISYDVENRPDVSNLVRIFANCTNATVEDVVKDARSFSNSKFKSSLADALIAFIAPLRKKIELYRSDPELLLKRLKDGREKAILQSSKTMQEVRDAIGLISLK